MWKQCKKSSDKACIVAHVTWKIKVYIDFLTIYIDHYSTDRVSLLTWKVHTMSCQYEQEWVYQCLTLIGGVGVNSPPNWFFRNWQNKRLRSVQKTHFHSFHPLWRWGVVIFIRIFFAKTCMNYSDLHTKVMFTDLNPHGAGLIHRRSFARNWVKCLVLHRKLMLCNLQKGKGLGQFTCIFF